MMTYGQPPVRSAGIWVTNMVPMNALTAPTHRRIMPSRRGAITPAYSTASLSNQSALSIGRWLSGQLSAR